MGILSLSHQKIIKDLIPVLLPPTEAIPVTVDGDQFIEHIEDHLQSLSRLMRVNFIICLNLFNWVAMVWGRKLFTRLNSDQQGRYLDWWEARQSYPLRLLVRLMTSVIYVNYYSEPEIYQHLGYSLPPVTVKEARPPPDNLVPFPDKDMFLRVEICVIGSGAGGAVVAKHLAEQGLDVVILEEGGYYNVHDFAQDPHAILKKAYRDGGFESTFGFPVILTPTGKAVGGTTLINSGTCFRLPESVLEQWNQKHGLNISYKEMLPYFFDVEKMLGVAEATEETLGKLNEVVKRGMDKLGLHGAPLRRNAPNCKASGRCCFGCPTEAKQSTNLNYIPEALAHGAHLYSNCRAEKIIPKADHGAEILGSFIDPVTKEKKHSLHIKAEVLVLAGGSYQTPLLLKRNQLLRHNRHLGRHLTIHPAAKVIAHFHEDIQGWNGIPQGFFLDQWRESGMTFEGAFTPPAFGAAALNMPRRQHRLIMENYRNMSSFGFLVSDHGEGRVMLLPNGDPFVFYNLAKEDLGKFKKGLRLLCQIYLAAGAHEVYTGIHSFPRVTTEKDLVHLDQLKIKRSDLDLGAFHPLGTCRMGAQQDQAVIDPHGEIHGMKNIFVADGSIFPSSLGVNPMISIMAFAARTADAIHERRLRRY